MISKNIIILILVITIILLIVYFYYDKNNLGKIEKFNVTKPKNKHVRFNDDVQKNIFVISSSEKSNDQLFCDNSNINNGKYNSIKNIKIPSSIDNKASVISSYDEKKNCHSKKYSINNNLNTNDLIDHNSMDYTLVNNDSKDYDSTDYEFENGNSINKINNFDYLDNNDSVSDYCSGDSISKNNRFCNKNKLDNECPKINKNICPISNCVQSDNDDNKPWDHIFGQPLLPDEEKNKYYDNMKKEYENINKSMCKYGDYITDKSTIIETDVTINPFGSEKKFTGKTIKEIYDKKVQGPKFKSKKIIKKTPSEIFYCNENELNGGEIIGSNLCAYDENKKYRNANFCHEFIN